VRKLRVVSLFVLAVGCSTRSTSPPPHTTPVIRGDFRASQIRQTAVVLRIQVSPAARLPDSDRSALPSVYEHMLVEALDARALLVRDMQRVTGGDVARQAAARARDVGADHALAVELEVEPDIVRLCEEMAQPLRGRTTVLKQQATIVRASDGQVRASTEVSTPVVEAECDSRRPIVRGRSVDATAAAAVERLLGRLLGP
jgi:hypothetical protein